MSSYSLPYVDTSRIRSVLVLLRKSVWGVRDMASESLLVSFLAVVSAFCMVESLRHCGLRSSQTCGLPRNFHNSKKIPVFLLTKDPRTRYDCCRLVALAKISFELRLFPQAFFLRLSLCQVIVNVHSISARNIPTPPAPKQLELF